MQSLSDDDGFRHQGGVAGCQTDMIAELMAALFFPPLTQRLLIFLLSDVKFFFPSFFLSRPWQNRPRRTTKGKRTTWKVLPASSGNRTNSVYLTS